MRYVVYDQFHWGRPDHIEHPVCGTWDEILEQYAFYKECHPDESLGLLEEEKYKEMRLNLK